MNVTDLYTDTTVLEQLYDRSPLLTLGMAFYLSAFLARCIFYTPSYHDRDEEFENYEEEDYEEDDYEEDDCEEEIESSYEDEDPLHVRRSTGGMAIFTPVQF